MSQICLYIPLEDYLAQWFVHEQGGEVPVQLTRGSVESKILEVYLAHRPSRFDVQLWIDLHHFGKISKRQDELIYAWMEKHGIELTETNWNAIAKRYQRQRNVYLSRQRAKVHYERKKST